jgi:hypothetical protein
VKRIDEVFVRDEEGWEYNLPVRSLALALSNGTELVDFRPTPRARGASGVSFKSAIAALCSILPIRVKEEVRRLARFSHEFGRDIDYRLNYYGKDADFDFHVFANKDMAEIHLCRYDEKSRAPIRGKTLIYAVTYDGMGVAEPRPLSRALDINQRVATA